MFSIMKTFRFEASHRLPSHDGKCARLHGHSWVMRVEVRSETIETTGSKAGMVMDFGDLKAIVSPIVDEFLDHHHLNDTTGLTNPTSEALARWVFHRLLPFFEPGNAPALVAVEIEETCTSRCRYER